MRRFTSYILALTAAALMMLSSCDSNLGYDRYRSVNVDGWNRADTLDFDAGRLTPGTYQMLVGFKATTTFPYKDLGINIDYTVYPAKKTVHKFIKCNVFDDSGHMTGNSGISADDFLFNIGNITVEQGDSVVFTVSHGMNQDDMPGITAVGLKLERQ